MTKFDNEYFQEKFPNLSEEIENQTKTLRIDGVRTNSEEGEKASKSAKHSSPATIDYIRLCDTEDEALEVINYLEDEGKIEPEYAKKLRTQLTNRGLESFGSKRDPGEYPFIK